MSPLESLAPDQRAVVALVLQQGRSYDDIAALLGIPVDAVRGRARAGLDALAPANGLPPEITGPIADYLLAQQPAGDAEATHGLLAESPPARAWAAGVADRLAGVAPAPLPEIPAAATGGTAASGSAAAREYDGAIEPGLAPSSANGTPASPHEGEAIPGTTPSAPRPVHATEPPAGQAPPASSKLGGVLLIAAVIAVVGVVLFLVARSGNDRSGEQNATARPAATATATATPPPQVTDQIAMRPPDGGKAKGVMTVYLQGQQLQFAIEGQDLPPSSDTAAYAVWLTGPGGKARRLGFTDPVGEDGALGIQGPSEKDRAAFPKLYATYENVVVSQERSEDAEQPNGVVLSGRLPAGR